MLVKLYESEEILNRPDENLINFFPNNNPHPAFGDFNGDGYVDILHSPSHFTHEPFIQPNLYVNAGDSFEVSKLPAGDIEYGRWTIVEDFNGDGFDDLVVLDTGLERPDAFLGANIEYFHGSANGLVNVSSKITNQPSWFEGSSGAFNHIGALGDIDKDGDLDLLVADFTIPGIYENNGNGSFDYISDRVWGDQFADYSGIGFVENKFGTPTIVAGGYRNFGDPRDIKRGVDIIQQVDSGLWEVVQQLEKPDTGPNAGDYGVTTIQTSDVEGDGDLDLIVEFEGNYQNVSISSHVGSTVYGVYLQRNDGQFEIDQSKTVEKVTFDGLGTVGFRLLDFNGDGFDDIFASGTGVQLDRIHETVLLNDRSGHFSPVDSAALYIDRDSIQTYPEFSVVPHWVDMNNDGLVDLVTIHPEYTHTSEGAGMVGEQVVVYGSETSVFARDRLNLEDRSIAFDLTGSAGLTAKTLAAVIGEDGLANKEYVGIGLQLFDAGQSLAAVCELALTAVGATTNEEVVNLLYTNLYGEAPTADVAQPFIDALNNGGFTKGSLAAAAAELTDDLGVIDLVGLAETGIEYV